MRRRPAGWAPRSDATTTRERHKEKAIYASAFSAKLRDTEPCAIAMPAIAGPTNRALLNTIELIATADGRDSRSTRFGINASRAGRAMALAEPSTSVSRDNLQIG